ncbi:MAG: tetratricopeptide repeat protein [Bacteroidota bacterium]
MREFLKRITYTIIAVIAIISLQSCSNENADKNLREGKILFEAKNFKSALDKFSKAVNDGNDETKAQAYYQRALTKEQLDDAKGAVNDYSEALKINKNDYESWHNRGILKDNLRDHNGAISDYTQAIALNGNRYEAFLNRGVAYSNLSKKREAMLDFENALRRNPKFARAWYFLALTKHDLNDTTACRDAKNAVVLGLPEASEFLKENCGKVVN